MKFCKPSCVVAEGEQVDVGEEGETVDILGEMYGTDENLPPLEKLERYFQSETVMDRYVYLCVGVGWWVGGWVVCLHMYRVSIVITEYR